MNNETLDHPFKTNGNIEIKPNAIKYGIIGGLIGVIVSLILYFTNLQFESWSKWLQSLIMIGTIILGIKVISDANKNNLLSFGTLFKAGILITVIVAIISIVYFLIYINFIETDFVGKVLEESRKQMAEKGLSDEQIDQALSMTKSFMSPGIMVLFSLIGSLFIGAIASVIGAAIFKNEK